MMMIRGLICVALLCGIAASRCRSTGIEEPSDATATETIVWTPFEVATPQGTIVCSLSRAPEPHSPPTLCMVLYSGTPVEKFLQRGARVLKVPVGWPGRLRKVAAATRAGNDLFVEENARLRAVNTKAIEAGLTAPGRTVLMGSSRDGFIALDAMAHIPEIGAATANQTVTFWPYLAEFRGMEGNAVLEKHDLQEHASLMAPRPVLLQIGYDDERVGTAPCRELAERLEQVYGQVDAADRTELHVLEIKGHGPSTPTPREDHRRMLRWLHEQGFIRDG